MKSTEKILSILWMVICGYFFTSLLRALFEYPTSQPFWMCLRLFFLVLHLSGFVAAIYLYMGARWSRIVLGLVALLTMIVSVMGFFCWFNERPFSVVGVAFDVFAVASAGFWFHSLRYRVAV
jgi:hypothetical protein